VAGSSRAAIVASIVALGLLAGTTGTPAAATTGRGLEATLALRFDDEGFGLVRTRLVVEGPADGPRLAAILAARAGTDEYSEAILDLPVWLSADAERLARQLRTVVAEAAARSPKRGDGPPAVTVKEGRATITFSGSQDAAGATSEESLWAESRRGSLVKFVVQREDEVPADVHWVVTADVPRSLEVVRRHPAPEREEVVAVNSVKRRELRWTFMPGDTREMVTLELKIHPPLRRTRHRLRAADRAVSCREAPQARGPRSRRPSQRPRAGQSRCGDSATAGRARSARAEPPERSSSRPGSSSPTDPLHLMLLMKDLRAFVEQQQTD
jgi:hypothetical protein